MTIRVLIVSIMALNLAQAASPYENWINEDVAYIVTADERQAWSKLISDQGREYFIEQFWLRRDPTPATSTNEFKEEHYRRIAYANDRFASSLPGWKTDRGRIYIKFGPPDENESHPSGGVNGIPPAEKWRYRRIQGLGSDVVFEFVDQGNKGEYRLLTDPSERKVAR